MEDKVYINLTDACSLKCRFCFKNNGEGPYAGDYDLHLERQPSAKEVRDALPDLADYGEVVFCGFGEPTLRLPTLLELADYLKRQGMPVRLNTDGLANRIYRRDITPQFEGRIDRLSVSLNAQDAETYRRLCNPPWPDAYDYLLDFIRNAREHVEEVTATAIDGLEGVDIAAVRKLAEEELGVRFRPRERDHILA
jgi:TatD DNase family protein